MKHLVMFVLAIVLTSCTSSPASRLPEETGSFTAPDITSNSEEEDITIAALDQLEIKVFNVPDLDGIYQVEPDGQMKMPLIGLVEADGFTIFELADTLEAKLEEKYLQNALVTIKIADTYSEKFTAEGAVRNPGMHPVRSDMTLLQAVALSGGPGPDANLRAVVIFRTIDGQRKAARFDLNKIRSGEAEDPKIYGNDIVMVDSRGENRAYDEVLRSLPLVGLFFAVF